MDRSSAEVREALDELQQYLSDQLAPLLVQDSMSVLIRRPASLVASAIQSWLQAQAGPDAVAVSDYLFHALWKIHAFGELDLVERGELSRYLKELSEEVLTYCPAGERERLQSNFGRLGHYEAAPGTSSSIDLLHRPPGAAPAGDSSRETTREVRRLRLLMERIGHFASAGPPYSIPGTASAPAAPRRELVSQAVAAAATSARSSQELDGHLRQFQHLGVAADSGELFETLTDSLPGWGVSLPAPSTEEEAPASSSHALNAMHRIIALAPDDAESSRRFRDLVHAGIKQFNEGLLSRAATIFDLAERVAGDKTVSPAAIDAVQRSGHEFLDRDRLRKTAESPEKRLLLRKVLQFFLELSPEALLNKLRVEEKRDGRRLLLSLLEVHGDRTRRACLERLEAVVDEGTTEPFFARNLLNLIRDVPPPEDAELEKEIALVDRAAPPEAPPELLKAAIGYLGQVRHDRSVAMLVSYLDAFAGQLVVLGSHDQDRRRELEPLLQRTMNALASSGTRDAVVAAVEHGLANDPSLGDTRSRLAALARCDLSEHPELLTRILEKLQALLPKKFVGRFLKVDEDAIEHFVVALSGTRHEDVETMLRLVADRFANRKLGAAAENALTTMTDGARAPAPSPGLSGDLELFGLANLLQSLAGIDATGVVTLFDGDRNVSGTLRMRAGKLESCQTGMLRGNEGIYQLFERPFGGSFVFSSHREPEAENGASACTDVMALIMEGVRRYDEFQLASALVPDDAVMTVGTLAATPVEDETNEALAESVWERAISGATPAQLDAELPVDAFRVRRLLAHWVEEGSLQLSSRLSQSSAPASS